MTRVCKLQLLSRVVTEIRQQLPNTSNKHAGLVELWLAIYPVLIFLMKLKWFQMYNPVY